MNRLEGLLAALAAAPSEVEGDRLLAEGLRSATGALIAAVQRFEPATGRLRISHLAADRTIIEKLRRLLSQPVESLNLRPGAALAEIQKGPAAIEFSGLHQVLFGQVPEGVSSMLELSLGLGRAYGLALRSGERLHGTASLFMPGGGGGLELPELEGWAKAISEVLGRRRSGSRRMRAGRS